MFLSGVQRPDVQFLNFPKQENRNMRKTIVLLAMVAMASPLFGQQSLAEAAAAAKAPRAHQTAGDTPAPEQVMKLLDLLQLRKNMTVMLDGMKQVMKEGAEQGFRERVPNPTPQQLEALNAMMEDMLADMPLDEMIAAIVPIYQRHLSRSDIEELIRFYSSPVGQKLVREQGPMLRESMEAGAQIQQKRMNQILDKIRARAEKMVEEGSKEQTPKK
jgi:uncharacterized protein